MPSQQFLTDPDALRSAGDSFEGIGKAFSAAAKTLKSTLDGLGEPWSGDTFGEAVASVYVPVKEGFDESMPHLGEQLTKIGESLKSMADNYESSDTYAGDHITGIGAERPVIAL
jgi:uncharacterized protein YukE